MQQGTDKRGANIGVARLRAISAWAIAGLASLLLWTAPADALPQRGHVPAASFGAALASEGDTAMSDPTAVAVDEATGDAYVLDTGNSRVLRFGPAPEHRFLEAWGFGVANGAKEYQRCASNCGAGIAGVHAGQFDLPMAIAVDNSPGPSHGDVYVAANRTFKDAAVDKFTAEGKALAPLPEEEELVEGGVVGVAVAVDGSVWVEREDEEAEFLLEHFSGAEDNALLAMEELELEGVALNPGETYPSRAGFAVDSRGDAYITYQRGGKDAEEHGKNEQCTAHVCTTAKVKVSEEFGSLEAQMVSSELDEEAATGVAVELTGEGQASDDVYLDNGSSIAAFTAAGTLIQRFGQGTLQEGAGLAVDAETNEVLVADATGAHVDVFGPAAAGAPAVAEDSVAAHVTSDSAELRATIDPNGASTHYRFEYGTASCAAVPDPCSEAPAAPGREIPVLGDGFGDQAVTETVTGLEPATRYYLRVLADNANGHSVSAERTFVTSAAPRELADGRAWEMVSLPDKHGSAVEAIRLAGGLVQSAASGRSVTYVTTGPVYEEEAEVEGNRDSERSQILSARGASRWSSHDIATPNEQALGTEPGLPLEYQFFSPELTEALVEPVSPQPLSAETTEKTGYLRHNATCRAEPASCFEPLVTTADDTAGSAFGFTTSFVGATPDLRHIVLHANVALIAGAPKEALYEWSAGKPASERLQLVSVLEGGAPAPPGAELGGGAKEMHSTAISTNGTRVVWRIGGENVGHLYTRDMETGETLQVDEPEEGTIQQLGSIPDFKTASADGSKVYFTDEQHLTKNASGLEQGNIEAAPRNLYVFEASRPKGHRVTDLTPESHELNHDEGAGVLGEASVGENSAGSFVYFVANGKLTSKAAPGHCHAEAPASTSCNLYVVHGVPVLEGGVEHESWGAPELIAQLSSQDSPDWGAPEGTETGEAGAYNLKSMTSRVSPNGEYLAFMSERPLTGYDNTDVNSGAADEEVFLYKYASEGKGELLCPSCKADGEPPSGVHDTPEVGEGLGLVVDRPETWSTEAEEGVDHWLAGSIPGWTNIAKQISYYQSRYLSDNGRLFFNSNDSLVPGDNNDKEDVYEYEPAAVGSCHAEAGCVALMSSGESSRESAFLDASEDGDDVFFVTNGQLAPQDTDTAADIYDARVCRESGSEPCLTPPAAPPEGCDSEAECKAPALPQSSYEVPVSATFTGPGNPVPGGAVEASEQSKKSTPKPLTRAQKLTAALKKCHKLKHRKKRLACERQARRSYGARRVAKKSSTASHRLAGKTSSRTGH